MTLQIQKHVSSAVIEHALHAAPIEACGYLAGNGVEVSQAVPLRNIDESAEHYSLDPKEQFDTVRDLRKRGLKVMAVYHSHPASPARMSQEDIRLAYDPNLSYVIVSLEDGSAAIKSFRVQSGVVNEEKIAII